MSLTKVSYSMIAGASANAIDFGLSTSGTAAVNTTAIQAAISSISAIGGIVEIPSGTYSINSITIPAEVVIQGAGPKATIFNFAGSTTAFTLGGTDAVLYYNCGILNLAIVMTNSAATAVKCQGTAFAKVVDLYIEGPIVAPRTTAGVIIDGSNASSFFNDVRNVQCNHIHVGYQVLSTGSQVATQTMFYNCTMFGDVATDTTSIGILISTFDGNGVNWIGGNLEHCGYAFYFQTSAGSSLFTGTRLEANTYDIYIETTPNPQTFIGLINLDFAKVVDGSGTGYDQHTFVGCLAPDGTDEGTPRNIFPGISTFKAMAADKTPAVVQGYPAQTAALQQWKNSAGTVLTAIEGGAVRINGSATTVGAGEISIGSNTATTVGAAGGGSALPATPIGYLIINVAGTNVKVPYYTA